MQPVSTSKAFRFGILGFLAFYVIYVFATPDSYSEAIQCASRREAWPIFRLFTIAFATRFAWRLTVSRPANIASYIVSSATGGLLLFILLVIVRFPGLLIGAAFNYGVVSGFYGAGKKSLLSAALVGLLALIAQFAFDVFCFLIIVGCSFTGFM